VPLLDGEDPTQSGFAVSRLFKTMGFCRKEWLINPSQIPKALKAGVKVLIFIDDFLGTGEQFTAVGNTMDIKSLSKNTYTIYAPLAAHENGVRNIKAIFPNVKVTAAEILRDESEVFKSCFDDSVNTPEMAKIFYKEFLGKNGMKDKKKGSRFNLRIAYAFEHGVPNNSIKILYHATNWNQLFNR
jgi:hypothetical protein